MEYPSTTTVCNVIVTILAFLPLLLSLLDDRKGLPLPQPEPMEEQEPEVAPAEQEVVYRPILSYVVSDIEVAMIETLCEKNGDMTSKEIFNSIVAFYPELGRKAVNRSLYRLYDQSIVTMRRDGNTPLWSISA
jgi:hypothetical protein